MKQTILLLLLCVFAATSASAISSTVLFKAKFVLKNKTIFTAYFLGSDLDIQDENGKYISYEKCTDKIFQKLLNKQNNNCTSTETDKKIKGVRLYKNIYGIRKPAAMQIPVFGFCDKTDIVDIDANEILYTVFLGANKPNFPRFDSYGTPIETLDSASVQDLTTNKIISNFILNDPKDFSFGFHFITTDKTINAKKLSAIVRSKKYNLQKMLSERTYYNRIKTEMTKQRIYLFTEYQD
jgi:hypothetical protein